MVESKITIGYWDIRGLAAPIRYLLEYLSVDYNDHHYFYGEAPDFNKDSWFKVKHSLGFDFPNLPYLVDGGLKITESHAIFRYISNKHKPDLLGKTIEEKGKVDMLMGYIQDIRTGTYGFIYDSGDL